MSTHDDTEPPANIPHPLSLTGEEAPIATVLEGVAVHLCGLPELAGQLTAAAERLAYLETQAHTLAPAHSRAWRFFLDHKLLWWVNRSLHLFGWTLVVEEEVATGEVVAAYPVRVSYRGFGRLNEEQGFQGLTEYLANEAPGLVADLEDDPTEDAPQEQTP